MFSFWSSTLQNIYICIYIHTDVHTSERERKETQTNPLWKLNYLSECILLFSNYDFGPFFGTRPPGHEGLWIAYRSCVLQGLWESPQQRERCSPDANKKNLLSVYLYGTTLKTQQRVLKNNHSHHKGRLEFYIALNWAIIWILLKKITERSVLLYIIPQRGGKNMQQPHWH